ncbi:hypothetical protein CEXT_476161 [Caerostris extrusa]|uniref:Uncharacterized protein n=1 Tax=Caerostris extrusa TaxID=172846 RepID=A0AAV4WCW2_CAEEX|nr:hypothetical protein CEXT_476161 [Caerostris extrusa]
MNIQQRAIADSQFNVISSINSHKQVGHLQLHGLKPCLTRISRYNTRPLSLKATNLPTVHKSTNWKILFGEVLYTALDAVHSILNREHWY